MPIRYQSIVDRIQSLSDERYQLYLLAAQRDLSDGQRRRLAEIKEELNALWLTRKRERVHFQDALDALVEQQYKRPAERYARGA